MSQYQFYDFRTLDRPLGRAEQSELRALSSRARITATGFTNHYDWGDFGGDPDRLMERYFDLFVYMADWGARRLSMRLPQRLVESVALKPFLADAGDVKVRRKGDHLIVDIWRNEIELDGEEEPDGGHGWLDTLAPLRASLLEGDLRVFYLVWLMAVQEGQVPDESLEPLCGIAPLTTALEQFADFFFIPADLVDAAAQAGAAPSAPKPSRTAVETAIAEIGEQDKKALLLRLYEGDVHVRADLLRRLQPRWAPARDPQKRRTAGELRAAAVRMHQERLRALEARREAERRREEKRAAEEKRLRLVALAARGDAAWRQVERLIADRNRLGYEKASNLLVDLREIALSHDTDDEFHRRLLDIRERHRSKPRFIERLDTVGLD